MTAFAFLFLSLLVLVQCEEPGRTYHNSKVLSLEVTDVDDLHFLAEQYESNRSLDFWIEPRSLGIVDVRIEPEIYDEFTAILTAKDIPYSIMIDDVQVAIDQQMVGKIDAFSYYQYNSLADIQAWMRTLVRDHPNFVSHFSVGKSSQGREMEGIRITTGKGTKPRAIWFNGGIHAREWLSPATVIYMTGHLLETYNSDPEVKEILDGLEIYILPVFNVDGYFYTRPTSEGGANVRLWRKTRSTNSGSTCIGTDPNRNWGYRWGGAGASTDPCSETYRGSAAFSAIEVARVADFLETIKGKLYGFIDFHCYSQMWLAPWGWTSAYPTDYTAQNNMARDAVAALTRMYQTRYLYGPIYEVIYPASGGSNDYTYGQLGVIYSYAPELRPSAGTGNGFVQPTSQIEPTALETFAALKVWALASLKAPPK